MCHKAFSSAVIYVCFDNINNEHASRIRGHFPLFKGQQIHVHNQKASSHDGYVFITHKVD